VQPRRLVVAPDDADAAVAEPRPQRARARARPGTDRRRGAGVRSERRALDGRERVRRRRRPAARGGSEALHALHVDVAREEIEQLAERLAAPRLARAARSSSGPGRARRSCRAGSAATS
jgi:hypothetical protein